MLSLMTDVYNELENASPFIDLKWVWIPFLISSGILIIIIISQLSTWLKGIKKILEINSKIGKRFIVFVMFFCLLLSMFSLQDVINIYINARQNDSDILDLLLCLKKISYIIMCLSIYFSLRTDVTSPNVIRLWYFLPKGKLQP